MKKEKSEIEETPYAVFYLIALAITLFFHYFLLADLPLHPTLNLFIAFLVFSFLLGFIIIFFERKKE